MAHPNHHGSLDPLHRARTGSGSSQTVPQEYLPFQQHAYEFDYNHVRQAGQTSPINQSLHYVPNMVMEQQQRRNLGVNVQEHHMPAITFEYAPQGHQQNHPGLPQQFYSNPVADGNAGPSSLPETTSPFNNFHQNTDSQMYLDLPPPAWTGGSGGGQTSPTTSNGKVRGQGAKVPRHQFTACGACRHRRVKCDLRTRQEDAERSAALEDQQNGSTGSIRRRKVSCTNCQERGTNCVDEYAPLKAAKQLRRGKRISEIEMLYGRSATDAALASQGDDADANSPSGKLERLPELTREFFESGFFRRLMIHRPVLDSFEFVTRYLSKSIPCAAAMGADGSIVCHTLYAWAVSFSLDENGKLDVPEGGGEPLGPLNLLNATEAEARREVDRQKRMEKMNRIVRSILREMDEYGLLRKPSLDGVRALFLILPLTENIASAVERQAMYQAALSHVQMLCTGDGLGYDGFRPTFPPSPILDEQERQRIVRMRIFWYAFVHESVTAGLKGGNLFLDEDEEMLAVEQGLQKQAFVQTPGHFHTSPGMVHAPLRLAMACRIIHAQLTSPRARRRDVPDSDEVTKAWEGLDVVWDEFERLKGEPPAAPFREADEMGRYGDGWKHVIFEALHVMRTNLEDRLERLEARASMGLADSGSLGSSSGGMGSGSGGNSPTMIETPKALTALRVLCGIARRQYDKRAHMLVDVARAHTGSQLYEWDSGTVRDATFSAALHLLSQPDTDGEVTLLLTVLNESRWAYARGAERSQELRKAWLEARSGIVPSPNATPLGSNVDMSLSARSSPFKSPKPESHDGASRVNSMPSMTPWQPDTPPGPLAMDALQQRSKSDPNPFAGFQHSVQYLPNGQVITHPDGSQVFVPYPIQ